MRSFTAILASASVLLVGALAAPSADSAEAYGTRLGQWGEGKRPKWYPNHGGACLNADQAQGVATNFKNLIADYSDALANASLTVDFVDYSDSVIELIDSGCPNSPVQLGSPTFTSRATFEAGQSAQPAIPFEQLNIWHNCDTVTLRWKSSGPGQEPAQVTGIIVLETVYQNKKWLIKTVFSEFNSGAWLVNLGIFKPANCTAA